MSKNLFYELNFAPEIAYGATGGPEFFTDVLTSNSGFEQRNINWLYPRNKYNLAPAIKTKEQLDYLISFFRMCQGKAIGFRFKDWADYQIKEQIIAVADGKTSEFQLIKNYHDIVRKINKPKGDTIQVFVNEQESKFLIESNTGIIKFAEPPKEGAIIKAVGEFDVPVRFDTDHLITSIENYGIYSHYEIPLIEIKL